MLCYCIMGVWKTGALAPPPESAYYRNLEGYSSFFVISIISIDGHIIEILLDYTKYWRLIGSEL